MKKIWFAVLSFTALVALQSSVLAQYTILYSTFGSGGGRTEGSSVSLQGTIGQSVAGFTENESHAAGSGFWYVVQSSITTDVERLHEMLPLEFRMDQNYPNPFNPSTTIRFALPLEEHVTLVVYDLIGRKIAMLVDERMTAGEYSVVFDAAGVASGFYIYRIQAGSHVTTRRMILLK